MPRRPKRFHDFIGQQNAVNQVKRLVDGSKQRGEVCPPLLFVGPPGMGKTALAKAAAAEYGSTCHENVASPSLHPADLLNVVATLNHGDVLFIDEAHGLRAETQEALYRPLDEAKALRSGKGQVNRTPESVASFTLIVATNKPGSLTTAFRSRLVKIEFEPYRPADLKVIAQQAAEEKGLLLTGQGAGWLAAMPQNSPREIDKLLEELKRYFPGQVKFGKEEVQELLDRKGIDGRWLSPHQRWYLQILNNNSGKPCSLSRLACLLQLDARGIEEDLEPLLVNQGLIDVASHGRKLTAEGRKAAAEYATQAESHAHAPVKDEVA